MSENPKRILILDDEEPIRRFLSDELFIYGELVLAENAHDAIDLVAKTKVHLAIVDIMMPGRDGVFFVKELWRISPKTKIILMSGQKKREELEEQLVFSDFNIVGFFEKPIEISKLREQIEGVFA